nr:probable phospholipid hydroperoxide glutathione peroxidase [Tanacetum cinerariifolium]
MKFTAFALAAAATCSLAFIAPKPATMNPATTVAAPATVYDFTVKTIDGKDVKLSNFNQELASNEEVASFCEKNYGVTFPLFSTVAVKGDDATPLYKFLADKDKNGAVSDAPTWNFCKYLVDEKGHVVAFYPSK